MVEYKKVLITKIDGEQEYFEVGKLEYSLRKAGAKEKTIKDIVQHVNEELVEGMSTGAIYRHAFELLQKKERVSAARYSMKRAVLELGPSGFPFEDFVAEIFKAKGYKVSVGEIMKGACIEHEIDVCAKKTGNNIACELKFHNSLGIKSDVKVALYVNSRFEDLKPSGINEMWLMTNTKFTHNAVKYGECVGLNMISWDYPKHGNLQDLIEEAAVHPVTCLTTLSKSNKLSLLSEKVVLCNSLKENPSFLQDSLGMNDEKVQEVLNESMDLCKPPPKV